MATATSSDLGIGLGLAFSIVSVAAAAATAYLGYVYAIRHANEVAADAVQINAAMAFGAAMLAGGLAIVAIHVYEA